MGSHVRGSMLDLGEHRGKRWIAPLSFKSVEKRDRKARAWPRAGRATTIRGWGIEPTSSLEKGGRVNLVVMGSCVARMYCCMCRCVSPEARVAAMQHIVVAHKSPVSQEWNAKAQTVPAQEIR